MSKNSEILLTESAVNFLKDEIGGGQGGSQLYYVGLYCDINGYPSYITIQVDDANLETYNDVLSYLKRKGFEVLANPEGYYLPTVGCNPEVGDGSGITGIAVGLDDDENEIISCLVGGSTYQMSDGGFSITYLGQNQGE